MNVASDARRLLTVNLGVRPRDAVLVLTDLHPSRPRAITALAASIARAGAGLARVRLAVIRETGGSGVEPGVEAWRAALGPAAVGELVAGGLLEPLLRKRASAVQVRRAASAVRRHRKGAVRAALLLTTWSATHTRFRGLLSDAAGATVASMPGFEARMFRTAMAVDWNRLAARTRRVAAWLDGATEVRLVNGDGSNLEFSLAGRRAVADTGLLRGTAFGNLPAGEAFVAPVEGSASGTLVVRSGPGRVFPGGLVFRVADGRIRSVTGGGSAGREVAGLFRAHPGFGVVAEFGVGTNPLARRGTNILEAEKILGTVHVAFGDNSTFGGRHRVPFHQDFLVFRPTVTVRGRGGRWFTLLDRGRLRAGA